MLDEQQKYVVSRTMREPLPWQNSTLLHGDAADSVRQLAAKIDHDLTIIGSGELVRSLAAADLVDQYVLLVHPLLLGSGRCLFAADAPRQQLTLTNSVTTTTGVILATYTRIRDAG